MDGFFPRSSVGRLRDPVVPVPTGGLRVGEQKKKRERRGLDTCGKEGVEEFLEEWSVDESWQGVKEYLG